MPHGHAMVLAGSKGGFTASAFQNFTSSKQKNPGIRQIIHYFPADLSYISPAACEAAHVQEGYLHQRCLMADQTSIATQILRSS